MKGELIDVRAPMAVGFMVESYHIKKHQLKLSPNLSCQIKPAENGKVVVIGPDS